MADYEIKQLDETPDLSGTITETDGTPADLSGCTVAINMRAIGGDTVIDNDEVTVDQVEDLELFPNTKGTWHYDLDVAELEGDTGYLFELIVTNTDGDERTFPIRDYYTLAVYARLAVDAS